MRSGKILRDQIRSYEVIIYKTNIYTPYRRHTCGIVLFPYFNPVLDVLCVQSRKILDELEILSAV